MVDHTCRGCGVVFGMPDVLFADLKRTGKGFTCPNGCTRYFVKQPTPQQIEIDRLRKRLQMANREWAVQYEIACERLREMRRCPLCNEMTSRARSEQTIRERVANHLRDEHGARQRLRALPLKASEAR